MKLRYTLAAGALMLATATQAQTWIPDTADMTSGYAKNIYYSLENGSVKAEDANNWDIAIKASGMSVGVYANHAVNNVMVYPLTGLSATIKFGEDLTDDTTGIVGAPLYNSLQSWDAGAFNMDADPTDPFDFGWGIYDVNTHIITGDKIYMVQIGAALYQVWIKEDVATLNNAHWTIKIANLDGTNPKSKEFDINPTYANKLFAYYNFTTDQFLDRDPVSSSWDFVLTKYTEPVVMGPGDPVMYPVTGVLSNEKRGVVRLSGAQAINATWATSMESGLDSTVNIIGRNWKGSNFANGVYPIEDSLTYFMKVPSGDVWQFEFTYASLGNTGNPDILPGRVGLRKRKVYTKPPTPTGVEELNAYVNNLLVVPNPSVNGATNLLVDVKQELKNAQLSIVDLNGRVVMKTTQDIKAGFQQIRLNVSQYPAGIYMINLSGAGFSTSQKMVVK